MRAVTLILLGVCAGAALAVLTGPACAQSVGGAASLMISPGARADGMGRSFVSLADDGTAVWWNPAALAYTKNRNLSAMHAQLVPELASDVYYEYLGYTQYLEGWGGLGFSIVYLTYGKQIATDEGGQELGTFSSFEVSPSVAYGTELMENLAVGINLKFVHIDLAPKWATLEGIPGKGNTFAVDLGVLFTAMDQRLAVGGIFQNLGPKIAYIDEDQADPLSRNLKVGLSYLVFRRGDSHLVGSFDVNKPMVYWEDEPIYNGGAEYRFNDLLAVRAGYVYDDQGTIKGPTFGIGLALGPYSFDYASVPQSVYLEKRVSKFSLNARF
jgi:long-subunit fatty acid transport protein